MFDSTGDVYLVNECGATLKNLMAAFWTYLYYKEYKNRYDNDTAGLLAAAVSCRICLRDDQEMHKDLIKSDIFIEEMTRLKEYDILKKPYTYYIYITICGIALKYKNNPSLDVMKQHALAEGIRYGLVDEKVFDEATKNIMIFNLLPQVNLMAKALCNEAKKSI